MDFYFQGHGLVQQGYYPGQCRRKPEAFSIAHLSPISDNVDALVGSATADVIGGFNIFVTDRMAAFAAAEAKVTKALSAVPDHARGHLCLGLVKILTKRAAEGISECEHALALERSFASAHAAIAIGKLFIGRFDETETHIHDALRSIPEMRGLTFTEDDGRRRGETPAWLLRAGNVMVPASDRRQPEYPARAF